MNQIDITEASLVVEEDEDDEDMTISDVSEDKEIELNT